MEWEKLLIVAKKLPHTQINDKFVADEALSDEENGCKGFVNCKAVRSACFPLAVRSLPQAHAAGLCRLRRWGFDVCKVCYESTVRY